MEEDEENENYGKMRMRDRLLEKGHRCSPSRVSRVMSEKGLTPVKKKKPNSLTKSDKAAQASDNLLKGDFSADKPKVKFVTDITQTPTIEGPLNISAIFDCYDIRRGVLKCPIICGLNSSAHHWRVQLR